MFCNNPIKVLISYKKFLWFKLFKKYSYRPCGLCAGCRGLRDMVNAQKFMEANPVLER